jgi:hypothetical protein
VVVSRLPGLVVPQEHPWLSLQEVSSLEIVILVNSGEWRVFQEKTQKIRMITWFLVIRTVKKTELSLELWTIFMLHSI